MNGFIVINPEVLVARQLERGGRFAPSLYFIKWRYAQLKEEVRDDAAFWGIPVRDICLTRAAQIAEARGVPRDASVPVLSARFYDSEDRVSLGRTRVDP